MIPTEPTQPETEDEARARRWADAIFDHISKEGVLGKEQIRTALLREMLVDKEARARPAPAKDLGVLVDEVLGKQGRTRAVDRLLVEAEHREEVAKSKYRTGSTWKEVMEPMKDVVLVKQDPRKTLLDKSEDWGFSRDWSITRRKGRLIPAKILGAIAYQGFKEGYPGTFQSMRAQFEYSTSMDAWTAVGAQMNVCGWDQPFEEVLGELHASYVDAKRGPLGPRHEPNNKSWTETFHRGWEGAAKAMMLAMYGVNRLDEDRGTQHAKTEPFGQPDRGDVRPLGQSKPDFKGLPY